MKRQWRFAGSGYTHYYFQVHNGKVIGQVYNYANTVIWGAKIPVSATEEEILGQYIEMEYAKKAIEEYWDGKDRTINYTTNGLITHHEE
jgi:rRNA processing protein Krr1/Pno1